MIWRWEKKIIFEISFSDGLFVKLVFSKCQIVKICVALPSCGWLAVAAMQSQITLPRN
jgi:hypothetical protein